MGSRNLYLRVMMLLVALVLLRVPAALAQPDPNDGRGFTPESVYDFHKLDSVNVFNGNLTVSIPLGQPFKVNGSLSYGLTLVYNSHLWHFNDNLDKNPPLQPIDTFTATPVRRFNAGLGWMITLGELVRPLGEEQTHQANHLDDLAYISNDGAEHGFFTTLHGDAPPADGFWYTRDGTYIRLRDRVVGGTSGSQTIRYVDLPDGTIQTFSLLQQQDGVWPTAVPGATGSKWCLTQMADHFGNAVNIGYSTTNGYSEIWTIIDPARTITLYFVPGGAYFDTMIHHIDMPSYTGTAEWSFSTPSLPISPVIGDTRTPLDQFLSVPVLDHVTPPVGNGYTMRRNGQPAYSTDRETSGVLTYLQLPTLGAIGWEYAVADFADGVRDSPRSPAVDHPNTCVARKTYDAGGNLLGTWTYGRIWGAQAHCTYACANNGGFCASGHSRQLTTWVTEPRSTQPDGSFGPALTTFSYFSAYRSVPNPGGDTCPADAVIVNNASPTLISQEYGLPLTRFVERNGRFLSTETRAGVDFEHAINGVFNGAGRVPPTGAVLRSTWLAYEMDGDGQPIAVGNDFNRRVKSTATYFEDDDGGVGGQAFSASNFFPHSFDGYGHYRQTSTEGNFPTPPGNMTLAGNNRTTFVNYAPDGSSWLLGSSTQKCVADDGSSPRSSDVADCGALQGMTELDSYDSHGALVAKRALLNPGVTLSGSDLLTVYGLDALGNLISEQSYGGDVKANASTTSPFAGTSDPEYKVTHDLTYTNGSGGALSSAKTSFPNGLVTSDEDFHYPTGLVTASRDSAGVPTLYSYDAMGRLLKATPQGDAFTSYTYNEASFGGSLVPASVAVTKTSQVGDGSVTKEYQYDDLGHLLREKTLLPDSSWSAIQHDYDLRGTLIATSTPQAWTSDASFAPLHKTQYGFDQFNRPFRTIAPDQSETYSLRTGNRILQRKLSPSDAALSLSTQYSDVFGRLVRVEEPSGPTNVAQTVGATVATTYQYDVAGHLTNVSMQGAEGVTQTRSFAYDNRGLLTSEQHPELGSAGNGATYYSLYDSVGHPGRKLSGADSRKFDLRFSYDAAQRLSNVGSFDDNGLARTIKEFQFADSNDTSGPSTDYRAGKLLHAVRHNYLATVPGDVAVTETYRYATASGRLSDRTTLVENVVSGARKTMQQFGQTFSYSDLGHLSALGYPKCDSSVPCGGAPPIDVLGLTHSNGALTAITGYAPSITYNPDGTVHTVTHGTNGNDNVVDTYTPDPHGMSRPAEITFQGWQDCPLPAPVTITTSANAVAGAGGLTASVTNDPSVTYAWSISGGTITSGAGTSSITYSAGGAGTLTLTLKLTNTCGSTTVTAPVTVAACSALSIRTQPLDASINPGRGPTLTVAVDAPAGSTLVYKWYQGLAGDTSQPVGTNSASFDTPQLTTTTQYWVQVSIAGANCLQNSVTATITVCRGPNIVQAPQSQTVAVGSAANLSVVATGDNLTYAWYDKADLTHALTHDPTYAPTFTATGTYHFHLDVGGCGTSVPFDVTVTVVPTVPTCPTFTISPPVLPVPPYATVFTLTVGVTGDPSQYHYQWYHGIGNASQALPSSDSSVLTRTLSTPYDAFWCVVTLSGTDANGAPVVLCTITTPKAYVRVWTVCPLPPLSIDPVNIMATAGQQITFKATSDWPTLTYQWYRGTSGDTRYPMAGQTGSSLTVNADVVPYWVRVTDECGVNHVDSQTVTVSVGTCSPVVINQQPQSVDAAAGDTSILSVDANSNSSLTYSWYELVDAADLSDPANRNPLLGSAPKVPVSPTRTSSYYAEITEYCTSNNAHTVTTLPAMVHVRSGCGITVSQQPTPSVTIIAGSSTTLQVAASSSGTIVYQWYSGDNGDTSHQIASGPSSITVSPSETTSYWVRLSTNSTCAIDSYSEVVNVCHPPAILPLWGSYASLGRGQSENLSISATGTGLTYQWYIGARGDTSNPIPGATFGSILITPQNTTTYWVLVSGSCGDALQSNAFTVAVCLPAVITQQPQSLYINPGTTTTLTVTAIEATSTPITYQWYRGLSGDITHPVGMNSLSFTTPPLTEETSYWVAVSSGECGGDSSTTATVSICQLSGTITGAPDQSISLAQGAHVELPPTSPPLGPLFFWYQGVSGDTSHPLGDLAGGWGPYDYIDVSPVVTTQYWAQVKNGTCMANTTTTTIRVCIPAITTHPAGLMINSGQSTTLTVVANTQGLTYQWYIGASSDTTSPISGATSASYIASPTVATSYWVRVTGTCGHSADSNAATITICAPPSAVVTSGGGEIVRGQSTTLSASSTGTSVTYQWYLGSASDTSTPIFAGAQSITVTPQDRTNYWVRASGACPTAKDSATVTVNVCVAPTITAQPQSVSIFNGNTATLSVTATVATATPLSYQWYRGASGDTSNPVGSLSTSSTFTTPTLTTDTSFWVAVFSDICGPTQSSTATVSMCVLGPTMTGPPNQSISLGQTAHLAIPPFSPTGNYSYFWYQGAAGDTSHPLGDLGGGWGPYNYLDVSPAVTTQYWAQIQNGTCITSTTTTTVSVCIPTIAMSPASIMINSGQTTTLTVVANPAGLTYQWYRGASGDTSAPVGTNSASFTTPALTVTTSYWVKVTGTCGQPVSSSTATVTICQIPAITVQPAGTSLVRGYSTTLSVAATGTNLSYQWYVGTSGNMSSPVAGNSNSYTVTAPQNPVDYWVKISGTCGTPVNSATAHISVCTTPTINTQPQGSYIFSGGSATLSVSASEATGETLHYQWHKGTTSPVNVGTDSPTYNTGALTADTSYFVTITAGTAGLCSVDSAAATVSICMYPQTVTGAPNANTSPGQTTRLQLASNPGVTSYLWYRGASGDTSSPITGWQAANYVDVAPTTTTSYWARWQANSGACISNTTTTTVNVCIPVITTQPANVTIASGSTTLSVVSNLPGSTYQWYIGASGTTTSPISGATSASVSVSPGTTTSYWVKVTGTCGQSVNSNTATVTICSPPAITHQPVNSSSYSGQLNILNVTATGTNLTYQWYLGASGDTSQPTSITTSSIQGGPSSSVQYWVKVSGTCGSVNSNAAWMSVYPGIIQQPQQTTYVSSGSKGNLFVYASGTGLHYQWWGDSGLVAGAPDSPNFITPNNITGTSNYYCMVSSSGGATVQTGTGTFFLCSGVPTSATTVTNAGGNCRNLLSNTAGTYDSITWYQGQRGDTSIQVGTNWYLSVCPTTSTTYWYRVYNTDQNLQVTCYADGPTVTVP
jgi:hypothetical protein